MTQTNKQPLSVQEIMERADEATKTIRSNLNQEQSIAITVGFQDVLAAQGGVRPAEVIVALADIFNEVNKRVDDDLYDVMIATFNQVAMELRDVSKKVEQDPMVILNRMFAGMFGAEIEPCGPDCTCA